MKVSNQLRIAVLGAGDMGTALSVCIANNGHEVNLWVRRKELCEKISKLRENPDYYPGISLPPNIQPVNNDKQCIDGADLIVFSVPSHAVREVSRRIAGSISEKNVVLNVAKGIEYPPPKRMSEILAEELPTKRIVVMSGPNFASELIHGVPSITTIASKDADSLSLVKRVLKSNSLIVDATDDVVGVEMGGIVKGIIAISMGIADALALGDNVRGILFTEGLREMNNLCRCLGGRTETSLGPSGVGDLATTAFSQKSRNRAIGFMLGLGLSSRVANSIAQDGIVVEGARSVAAIKEIAKERGVEAPIIDYIYKIFYEKESSIKDLFFELWANLIELATV
jgi:glycerol-3-phosphate dehydrogenase (NAD(P)+)